MVMVTSPSREKESSEWVPRYPSCAGHGWRNPFLPSSTQSTEAETPWLGGRGRLGERQIRDKVPADSGQQEVYPWLSGSTIPRNLPRPVGTPDTPSAKPIPPPTLWLIPCACSHVWWWERALVDRERVKKRGHRLWAREKPHTWAIVPPSGKQKEDSSSQLGWLIRRENRKV